MAVRGDEVASSIESHVRESIEKMVEEIRASIEDVRVAVDQQLKAALQSVQADVNSVSFLPHIQKAVTELEESMTAEVPPPAPAPEPVVTADASRVKQAVQTVERGKSQVDVLNALLEQCLAFGSRAALLILRDTTFSGWKGLGFSAHGGNDDSVKRFSAKADDVPELHALVSEERVVSFDGSDLSRRLGGSDATRAILVPMVIKDKVSAAVYVDAIGDDTAKLDPSSVQLLVFATGLLIDTLGIRKKSGSPTLNDGATVEAAPPPHHEPEVAPPPPPPPPPPPSIPPPEPPPQSAETVSFSVAQIREMMAAPAPAPPPPPPSAPVAPPPVAEHAERTSTQYVPPAGMTRTGAFGIGQTEEAKKQDEARRFARLLVSEIKLYNEAKVEQGRKNHDLYERLKEDIDRSRQMYDERISEDVRNTTNYFYDELVRILADGNADALGL